MLRGGKLLNQRRFLGLGRRERYTNSRIAAVARAALFFGISLGGYITFARRKEQDTGYNAEELDSLIQDLKKSEKLLRAHLNEEPIGRLRGRLRIRYRPPEEPTTKDVVIKDRKRAKRLRDPVRTKHLEQIASLLQAILLCLQSEDGMRPDAEQGRQYLRSLLEQLDNPAEISTDNAWELTGLFEIALVELASDPYLYSLLRGVSDKEDGKLRLSQVLKRWLGREPTSADLQDENDNKLQLRRFPYADDWDYHFPREDLEQLLGKYKNGKFRPDHIRLETRWHLTYLFMGRWDEYRHNRAMIRLLGKYARRLALLLALLVPALWISYVLANIPVPYTEDSVRQSFLFEVAYLPDIFPPASGGNPPVSIEDASNAVREVYLLVFVCLAGAVGSVFGRTVNFVRFRTNRQGDSENRSEDRRGEEGDDLDSVSIGSALSLRELLSELRNLWIQPFIGGTAGIIIYLTLRVGAFSVLSIGAYGIAAFLAGFSEAYFLNSVRRLGGLISPR